MLRIDPIPAFDDNYIWLLRQNGLGAVVDPGDADPVIATLEGLGVGLGAILLTHHHGDHVGGVEELIARYPGVRVVGPRDRRIPGVTHPVGEGDRLAVPGLGPEFSVWEVPGHTASHIAYLGDGALFCGDTLFAAGCGRVFDGTFPQLAASLRRIAGLPGETWVYCAHEYTLANLGFAAWVEPWSPAIAARRAAVWAARDAGRPTVPSRIAEELATNPFLRTDVPEVRAAAERFAGHALGDHAEVFKALRQWKDRAYD